MKSVSTNIKRRILLFTVLTSLLSCGLSGGVYQVYDGERLPPQAIATLVGSQFLRQDWLNRYTDAVRFARVDDIAIENSVAFSSLELLPGFHDVTVYFYWDLGTARGLAPALVSYAASRESLTRSMRFKARAGETYRVMAEPHFSESRQDITTLAHVDFWIVDRAGNEIVSKEAGRYLPETN